MMLPRLILFAFGAALLCGSSGATVATNGSYDYLVVGGGTAGLVVANRLSQDSSVTVAVIEAGGSVFNDPRVQNTTNYGLSLGTELDWQYTTVPQKYAANDIQTYHAGKALGGTSTINGMTYIRSETVQIDAWEKLGNSGWNWDSLYPYYKKSEHFDPPTPSQVANGAAYNPEYHGFDGPLDVGWQYVAPQRNNSAAIIKATWESVGSPYNKDVNGGYMRGFSVWPFTVNATTSIREDAARAYYYPVQDRPNLHVYLNTTALRLTWSDGGKSGANLSASGVEVSSSTVTITTLKAAKEVVVSLGSTRTPCFLEYSGIGNPAILEKYSIPVRISLPTVGENLQDQTNVPIVGALNPNDTTTFLDYPPEVTYATLTDLFPGSNLSALEASVRASIPSYAALNVANSGINPNNATRTAAVATAVEQQERILAAQADLIFSNAATLPLAEILTAPTSAPGLSAAILPTWALLPFGRGSIHISAPSPLGVGANASSPAINPNYFMNPFDNTVQTAAMRLARRALLTAPLADYVVGMTAPTVEEVPLGGGDDDDDDDAAWVAFAKGAYGPNSHPVGTAAMMGRELGGVVDAELRVYGTANVRVVDASVLPWQVCGHLTSTIYAVAERASDIIRGTVGKDGEGEGGS
ncbi:glucose oxidase [Diplodia corticola]|uniref:Glucose oxidase n=1 Tax=Diplodia corticola TaxID=236234 RepID=A0A1J9QV41_9PEZI|nr:glucose oxidase [Diplodia corticola]OJD31842.1 glucose oxidase [Diplodia corticola]